MSKLIYERDFIKLYHGLAENLDMLESGAVNLTVCSAPYNIKTGSSHKWKVDNWYDDSMPEDEYQDWQVQCLNEIYRVTKDGGSLLYNHKVRKRNKRTIHPLKWIFRSEWQLVQQITWDRGSTHNHGTRYYWPYDEQIYWLCKGDHFFNKEYGKWTTVWRMKFAVNSPHPAPFPEDLAARCILAHSKEGDLVLDPFMGSGTTAYVARNLNRMCVGVEKDIDYIEKMQIPRLSNLMLG